MMRPDHCAGDLSRETARANTQSGGKSVQMRRASYIVWICGGVVLLAANGAIAGSTAYPATACHDVTIPDDPISDSEGIYLNASTESIEPDHTGVSDPVADVYCPIARQKVGSTDGAKFYAYFDRPDDQDLISCTFTSRTPANGVLISSVTKELTAGLGDVGKVVLKGKITPSSKRGPYALHCVFSGDEDDPKLYGYRIKEY
jgi:hypothetical protein